jgi:PAS domain S-box-containing protein
MRIGDNHHRHTILIADDEEEIRNIIVSILKQDGYHFLTAAGAEEALLLLDIHIPCLVLTDVAMPGMNGFELCRRIRENHKTAHVPVAVISGKTDDEDYEVGVHAGADDYIKKPFDRAELRLRVRNLILLHESHRRHQMLFDNTSQGIIALSIETRKPVMVNKTICRMLGYSAPEMMDLSIFDLHPKEFADETERGISAGRLGETRLLSNIPFKKKSGDLLYVDMSTFPMSVDDIVCAVAFVTDVTERRHMEEELEDDKQRLQWMEAELLHAQKMEAVGRLASGIAHEINTPTQFVGDNTRFMKDAFSDISSVLNHYEKLLKAVQQGRDTGELTALCEKAMVDADIEYIMEEIPKAADQALEGVERIASIVRAMKEFAHPGGSEKVYADLNKLIETTVTVSRNEWKYAAEMKLDLDVSIPQVPCLPGEINQVLLNLIVNAAHAVSDASTKRGDGKGAITVSTSQVDSAVEIRIADTGTGIPEEIRDKVMEPFFTTKEVGRGTGQGLAIAHSVIVDKHDGSLFFETELGKGTTFVIQLPVCREESIQCEVMP